MTDDRAAYDLEASASEQSELDSLLVKLTTGALGFSIALGVLENSSRWLVASWFFFLPTIAAVLISKFMAIEALRADYQGQRHKDPEVSKRQKAKAKRLDKRVSRINYGAGAAFFVGAFLVVVHVLKTI